MNLTFFLHPYKANCLWQGFWRGNVPALLMVMPYTAIQFTVLHKFKTFAAGSSKTGVYESFLTLFVNLCIDLMSYQLIVVQS